MKRKPVLMVVILMMLWASIAPAVTHSSTSASAEMDGTKATAAPTSDGFWKRWSSPKNISYCPTHKASYPSLALRNDGRVVYLAWTDGRALSKDVYYAKSTDGGWTWATAKPAYATPRDSWRPSLAMSGNRAQLAWAEATSGLNHDTKQMALDDLSPLNVQNNRTVLAFQPHLASGPGDELHLALQGGQGTSPDILYTRKADGDTSWPPAQMVFEHTASGSHNPAIGVSDNGQTVHLVWQENFSGDKSEIYYMRGQWSDSAISWSSALSLSEGITRSVRPSIVVESDSKIHVVWGEQAAGYVEQYVRYARSDNGGSSWTNGKRVSSTPVSANNVAPTDIAPALVQTPSGGLCTAWHGFRPNADYEAEEIYISCSTDQGGSWSRLVNISRSPETISVRPVLTVASDGFLHVAWQELAGANPVTDFEIFYSRSYPHFVLLPLISRKP